ncbi:MAG: BrnT family toxin [Oscillospiraceae bacterium]|nr:BrnT family toxin [Oscillospiraceae bacterium]
MNKYDKLLTVCHCHRENGSVIRIISARKANKTEQDLYRGAL